MDNDEKVKARIAALIKDTLQQRDWNQSTLARQAGIPRDNVSRYSRGISMPSVEHAKKLAKVMNVDVNALLGTAPEVEVSEVDVKMTPSGRYLLNVRKELDADRLAKVLAALEDSGNCA